MSIEFNCSHCRRFLSTDDEKAGYTAKCPNCGEQIVVPSESEPSAQEPQDASQTSVASRSKKLTPVSSSGTAQNRASTSLPISAGMILRDAWAAYRSQMRECIAIFFSSAIICTVALLPFVILGGMIDEGAFGSDGLNGIMTLVALAFLAGAFGIQMFALASQLYFMLKVVRRQEIQISEIFAGWRYTWRVLLTSVPLGLMIAIGLYLYVVPGIVVAVIFWPIVYLAVDREVPVASTFSIAIQMTRRALGTILLLYLATLGLQTIGTLAFGIGLIATTPLSMLIFASAYEHISATSD